MDDLMMIEYLKRKGLYNMSDKEFDDKFKDIMYQHYMKGFDSSDTHKMVDEPKSPLSKVENLTSMRDNSTHFNESYAKYIVSNMCHYGSGRRYIGEKFDMAKAKEVCERYRGLIAPSVTYSDIYVAINSHYHDYNELFKTWFGEEVEHKIIESAIIFWFQDDDYKGGFKLWDYFKEN